jgi:hypothetical protein
MSAATPTNFDTFEDKDLSSFNPAFDCSLDGLFEQYFPQEDFPDSSESSNGSNILEELDTGLHPGTLFASPQFFRFGLSENQTQRSWKTNSLKGHKSAPGPQSQQLAHRLRPDGIGISHVELLTLEGKLSAQSHSLPSTSSPPVTPPSTPSERQQATRSSTPATSLSRGHRDCKKKSTPSMMRPSSYYARQESPSFHEWTERFKQVSLQTSMNNHPLSPPPSSKLSQHEQPSKNPLAAQNFGSCSPVASTSFNEHNQRAYNQTPMPSDEPYASTIQESRLSTAWMQIADLDLDTGSSEPGYTWSGFSEPSSLFGQNFDAHNQNQEIIHMPAEFASQGLMIQCDSFEDVFPNNQVLDKFSVSTLGTFDPGCAIDEDEENTTETYPAIDPFSLSQSQSQSQPPSPPSTPPRRSNSHKRSKIHRRKSNVASTPRTPKVQISGGGAVGFVNFTPSDSQKILGGVAPSGSSKTKARREKEASDRRRKLSEAAAKAIREAGGDVEALKKEGLLI